MRWLLAILLGIMSGAAHATVIDLRFDLYASGFLGQFSGQPAAPYDPITGRFHLVFDNSTSIEHEVRGLTVENFSFPYAVPLNFSYIRLSDQILIGTNTSTGSCNSSNNGFCLLFLNASRRPAVPVAFVYQSGDAVYLAPSTFRVTALPSNVPEPASWALTILGLAAIGYGLRHGRTAPRFA